MSKVAAAPEEKPGDRFASACVRKYRLVQPGGEGIGGTPRLPVSVREGTRDAPTSPTPCSCWPYAAERPTSYDRAMADAVVPPPAHPSGAARSAGTEGPADPVGPAGEAGQAGQAGPAAPAGEPVVAWSAAPDQRAGRPLLVALHGRGATERDLVGLAPYLPSGLVIAAVRGPIHEGGGFAWFANRGIGRPIPESLATHTGALLRWLDGLRDVHPRVSVLGFSGGAAMAGSLLLSDPFRFASTVLLSGTLPWDVGLDDGDGVLSGIPVFYGRSADDPVIPADLINRTLQWLRGPSGASLTEPSYQGFGHSISEAELADIAAFLGVTLMADG